VVCFFQNRSNFGGWYYERDGGGDMKEGWEIKKLGEVCEFKNGLWIGKKPPFQNVGVIRNTNFTKDGKLDDTDIVYLDVEQSQFVKRKLQFGDIILEKSGGGPKQPVGRVIVFDKTDGDFSFSNFTSVIRIKEFNEVDFNYLHRFLFFAYVSGATETMQSHSTGIRNLKFDEYKNIEISLPPLPEQQRIVSILDECFAAIAKAKANAEQNLKNAKELFESYLQGVFEKKGDDWVEKPLKELTTKIGSGATPRGGQENYKAEGISLVRSMNVHDWEFRERNLAFIDEKQAKELDGVTLQEDDVLFNITGASVARCCVFPKEYLPARVNQHVSIIRPKIDILDARYLNLLLTSKPYKDKLLFTGEQGATRQAITKAQIEVFRIAFPKLKEQQTIVRQLDALRAETKRLEAIYQQKLLYLEELKKSVLQKAFNGELQSPEGATYANDGCSPSDKKKSITCPEGATYANDGCSPSDKRLTTTTSPEGA
jgi:type I restriction enzyme, S subunit